MGVIVETPKGEGLVPTRELEIREGRDLRRALPVGTALRVVLLDSARGKLRFSAKRVSEVEARRDFREYKKSRSAGSGMGGLAAAFGGLDLSAIPKESAAAKVRKAERAREEERERQEREAQAAREAAAAEAARQKAAARRAAERQEAEARSASTPEAPRASTSPTPAADVAAGTGRAGARNERRRGARRASDER